VYFFFCLKGWIMHAYFKAIIIIIFSKKKIQSNPF